MVWFAYSVDTHGGTSGVPSPSCSSGPEAAIPIFLSLGGWHFRVPSYLQDTGPDAAR